MQQVVPLTSDPHQSYAITLTVDGKSLNLQLHIDYNEIAGYWTMDILDSLSVPLVLGIPLITGYWPAGNLLAQFGYMKIGSAFILCKSQAQMMAAQEDYPSWIPGSHELGTDFILLWADTAA